MDPALFDFDIWRKLSRSVMMDSAPFLGYGENQGELVLESRSLSIYPPAAVYIPQRSMW